MLACLQIFKPLMLPLLSTDTVSKHPVRALHDQMQQECRLLRLSVNMLACLQSFKPLMSPLLSPDTVSKHPIRVGAARLQAVWIHLLCVKPQG